jgi:hypothetical protein
MREKKKHKQQQKDAGNSDPESQREWPLLAERLKMAKAIMKRSTDILSFE